MRPVQDATVGGSHTSNLISESNDGRATPCTRQNGTATAAPLMVAGGFTNVADVMVDASGVTAVKPPQLTAACAAPDAPASARAIATPIGRLLLQLQLLLLLMRCIEPPDCAEWAHVPGLLV